MNRSYPRWFVGLALVFAEYGCAAEATSVATTTDQAEASIVQSSDSPPETRETPETESRESRETPETPETDEQTNQRSSAMSSMAVAIVGPVPRLSPPEEVLGPQPVPWCFTVVCEAAICHCITTLIDGPAPIDLEVKSARELGRWKLEPR